jgi:RNA processing factor Prp31
MVDNWHDPVRLRQLQLPLLQGPAMAQYLRDRLAQRIAELEGKPTITPKPAAKSTAATRKNPCPRRQRSPRPALDKARRRS